MKSTLHYFFCITFLFFVLHTNAQNARTTLDTINFNVWQNVNTTGATFKLPEPPLTFDSLKTKLYANPIDSLLALQVHIFEQSEFDETELVFSEALRKESSDTLRSIANLMLMITNSESTEVIEVQKNGVKGLQLGLRYLSLAADMPYHTFVQYYLYNNCFYAFTVTVAESELETGLWFKNRLFNSINFNNQ